MGSVLWQAAMSMQSPSTNLTPNLQVQDDVVAAGVNLGGY